MVRSTVMWLVLAAGILAAGTAGAQNGLGGIADSVSRLDRNIDAADRDRDGRLSREEAEAGHVAFVLRNFDAIDSAGRGSVSKDEVHAFIQGWLMQRQPAADK